MISRVEVYQFKAFERFTLHLRGDAYLAGPNNAGKSTLITCLRVAAQMLRMAMRRNPTETFDDGRNQVLGYPFTRSQAGLLDENLRHEFREHETRIVVRFRGNASVTAVWPVDEADTPYFYLQQGQASINNIAQAREAFPSIGIVPILAPVDSDEELLTPKYVRENLDGRLASRHFRNQLLLLDEVEDDEENLDAFLKFAAPWIPELAIGALDRHMGERNFILDLYYTEPGRRAEKELVWAGDGMQIWLQLLLHVFRLRERDVIVLDEPDVFLHPDLQRRLVRLLEALPGQTITATHSSEVLAEAPLEAVSWVDKGRRRSVAAPQASTLADLSTSLGSHFNIRLARALRAKVVLFVEGDDAKTLRSLAETVGARRVATETGIAVIPLKGFDRWEHVEPFSWMIQELLEHSVDVFVLLDRDFRSDQQCSEVKRRLRSANVRCHIWKRKELESYLLEHATIERLTSAPPDWVSDNLAAAADESEEHVFAQITAETLKQFPRDQQTQAVTAARQTFNATWVDEAGKRPWIAPPDNVLRALNRRLDADGYGTASFRALAKTMTESEVPAEMRTFLHRVEEALDEAGVPASVR